jgi:GDP-L-fucose synthase
MKILVTGGAGFLGSAVTRRFRDRGADVIVPRRTTCDLLDRGQVRALFAEARPTVVVHAAWTGGGIGFTRKHPAQSAFDNTLMAAHVVDACREYGVAKFVGVGSICSYPKHVAVPFRESTLWDGYPEETNAAYGVAKRMLLVLTQAYRQEYGLRGVHLLLVNLYGPGDNFDPEHGHVIPGMIRKLLEAREAGAPAVTLWGDGTPTREFLHVEDAANAIVSAAERYDSAEPVNIGTGDEISIAELARKVAALVGYTGGICWDSAMPNGQPRRRLDVSRAQAFGFCARVKLDVGLRETFEWYKEHRSWISQSACSPDAPSRGLTG